MEIGVLPSQVFLNNHNCETCSTFPEFDGCVWWYSMGISWGQNRGLVFIPCLNWLKTIFFREKQAYLGAQRHSLLWFITVYLGFQFPWWFCPKPIHSLVVTGRH